MKKIITIIIFSILGYGHSQIIPSNVTQPITNITMKSGPNKFIEWPTSAYGNGFGQRIISADFNGSTHLLFQVRNNTTTWSDLMDIRSNGRIGIGTTNPASKLDIREADGRGTWMNFQNESALTFFPGNGNSVFHISHGLNNNLYFSDGGSVRGNEIMVLRNTGQVAIGTDNFTQDNGNSTLLVNGKILCEEIEVIQNVAPDFVFQKYYTGTSELKADYYMPTIEEVEAYTRKNHHLPEVPSAAEIAEEGMQLKEMTTLLLQKVEELTLYTIEQEKRIKALEALLAEEDQGLNLPDTYKRLINIKD